MTGGRDFSDRMLVEKAFSDISLSAADILVEGEAHGADSLCAEVAREMGATVEPHPAKWSVYGGAAGHIRNAEMLRSGVDLLLSFPGGRGTRHCTITAREMGIPVILVRADGPSAEAPAEQLPVPTHGEPGEGLPEKEGDLWDALLSP